MKETICYCLNCDDRTRGNVVLTNTAFGKREYFQCLVCGQAYDLKTMREMTKFVKIQSKYANMASFDNMFKEDTQKVAR